MTQESGDCEQRNNANEIEEQEPNISSSNSNPVTTIENSNPNVPIQTIDGNIDIG